MQITIQGAIREYDAMTDEETLANGCPIEVREILSENMLLVGKV